VKGSFVNHVPSFRGSNRTTPAPRELGFVASFGHFFKRTIDDDVIVRGDDWLKESGVQQQLEFKGFQLRWVTANKLDANLGDGWLYVTVPHYLWWIRRVRRRYGPQNQYLLKKPRSSRSQPGY
jgi:hypothetical protein